MVPVKQEFRHKPADGVFGDCHRASIASVLELPLSEVPHFAVGGMDADAFNAAVERFLADRGMASFSLPMSDALELILDSVGRLNPTAYWLLGGKSRTGCNHTVVCKGGSIVHDPSHEGAGIIGPCDDGYYWATLITIGDRFTAPELLKAT